MIEIDLLRHVSVEGKPALYGVSDVSPSSQDNNKLLTVLTAQQNSESRYDDIISSPLQRCHKIAKAFAQQHQLPLTVVNDFQEMNFGLYDGVPFDDIPFGDAPFDDAPFSDAPSDSAPFGDASSDNVPFDEAAKSKKQRADKITESKLHWRCLERFFEQPAHITLPEAESLSDFHIRIIQAWQTLVNQQLAITQKQVAEAAASSTTLKPKRILLITHGGVIRMILAHILQLDWQQGAWHQNLKVDYASLSRVAISQYCVNKSEANLQQVNSVQDIAQPAIFQQVKTIAMPFLKEQPNEG